LGIAQAQLLEVSDSFLGENRVRHVRVEGTINMDDRSVLSRVSVRDGQHFPPAVFAEKVQSSVAALYESGFFDDVTAWVEYVGNDGELDLIFRVAELPALDSVIIEGYDEISEEDLRLKVSLVTGQVYSKSQLERDRQAILAHYKSEGYLLAEVGYRKRLFRNMRILLRLLFVKGLKYKWNPL
jgi:outer membrane protein insertion porin family